MSLGGGGCSGATTIRGHEKNVLCRCHEGFRNVQPEVGRTLRLEHLARQWLLPGAVDSASISLSVLKTVSHLATECEVERVWFAGC